jgi:hypothetical protein
MVIANNANAAIKAPIINSFMSSKVKVVVA